MQQALTKERLTQLSRDYRHRLVNDTLVFWLGRCTGFVDPVSGGYTTARAHDGTCVDTDKGVWQQGRTAWLLATLYNELEPNQRWLHAAASGIAFLESHGFDPADGRMWFQLTRVGRPIRKRRYAFSEAFAAIAFASYANATDDDRLATRAGECFDTFVNHQPEPKYTDTRPTRNIGVPMIAINVAQELRKTIGYDRADDIIDRCIETIETTFVKKDLGCVMETVAEDGSVLDHFDGRTLNPGHAIEAAWFILQEAKHRDDSQLTALGCRMLDWMWQRGWDPIHGGMLYFTSLDDKPVQEYWHDMKFWWPHCEAITATLLAYQLTGQAHYATWHTLVHDWAHQHFHDPKHGEWLGYLHRDGSPSSTLKGNLWKGPFHLPRMQHVCAGIVSELQEQCATGTTD